MSEVVLSASLQKSLQSLQGLSSSLQQGKIALQLSQQATEQLKSDVSSAVTATRGNKVNISA